MDFVEAEGCASCLSGLKSGLHGKLASMAGVLHKPKISWFNGAGGPVPITPGYVPYIVTTRSPRDFFSFAPLIPTPSERRKTEDEKEDRRKTIRIRGLQSSVFCVSEQDAWRDED